MEALRVYGSNYQKDTCAKGKTETSPEFVDLQQTLSWYKELHHILLIYTRIVPKILGFIFKQIKHSFKNYTTFNHIEYIALVVNFT